jgi:cytochrome c peroxidase
MRPGARVSWMLAALLFSGAASSEEPSRKGAPPPTLPPGVSAILWRVSVPPGAEPTPEKVALGQKLFLDKRLSLDDSVACSTCHDLEKGFVDGLPVSEGVEKRKGMRNSPTVLNAMFNATQFWDGRST